MIQRCAVAAILLLAACAGHAPIAGNGAGSGLVAQGQALAQARCASCHAIGSEGASVHAAAPPFRTLSQKYPIDQLAEAFGEGVGVGHPDMPPFALQPAEIDALLAYVQSVQD